MRLPSLLAVALLLAQCKTTGSATRRGTHQTQSTPASEVYVPIQDAVVIPRATEEATAIAVETEQVVTAKEVQNAPPIKVETSDAPPIMIQEIGSQCKPPVTAGCLGVSSVMTESTEGSGDLGKALKKYGRQITPATHACNYYTRNLTAYPNISYFTDLVVYWSETGAKINYWAFPVNFLFSAGCSLGEDFKNPFLAELKAAQTWDGTTSLKSLGYTFGVNLPLPANFLTDRLKAEKIPQDLHKCSWSVRPIIYAFPDGVIYQFVGGNTINVYTYNKANTQGCYVPKPVADAAVNYGLVCGRTAMNPDPGTRSNLVDLGFLNGTGVNRVLDANLLLNLETNGKLVPRTSFNCTWASRNRILQFSDGVAFIDDDCTNVNVFPNQSVKNQNCTLP